MRAAAKVAAPIHVTKGTVVSDLLLPPGVRLVHIGPQKTGSTAIQNSLHAAREQLPEHGAYYAGAGSRPREAGWAILGGKAPVGRPQPRMERWWELVEEVRNAGDLRVCVSNEDFGRATPEQIEAIVDGLGGDRAHVVAVVRRLDRYFPSQWQERVKAREVRSYEDWLRVILGDDQSDWQWKHIWYPHGVDGLVSRWTDVVGKDRMTLIVADDQNRALLPNTFEEMLGLPLGMLQMEELRSNRSLSYNEAEVLRALNIAFRANQMPDWAYAQYVQGGVIKGLKGRPRPEDHQSLPGLPPWAVERVEELSRKQAEAVRSSGVRVVGDPDRLVTPAETLRVDEPGTAPKVDVETAAQALSGLLDKAVRLHDREETRHQRQLRRVRRRRSRGTLLDDASGRELLASGLRRAAGRLTRR